MFTSFYINMLTRVVEIITAVIKLYGAETRMSAFYQTGIVKGAGTYNRGERRRYCIARCRTAPRRLAAMVG